MNEWIEFSQLKNYSENNLQVMCENNVKLW